MAKEFHLPITLLKYDIEKCIQNTANDSDYGFILYAFYLLACLFGWYVFLQSAMNCRTGPTALGGGPFRPNEVQLPCWQPLQAEVKWRGGNTLSCKKKCRWLSNVQWIFFWETYLIIPFFAPVSFSKGCRPFVMLYVANLWEVRIFLGEM